MAAGRALSGWTILAIFLGGLLMTVLVNLSQANSKLAQENRQLREEKTLNQAALFFIKTGRTDLYLHPVIYRLSGRIEPHLEAITALLDGPAPGSPYQAVFPKGSRVLGLEIQDGLAVVNLNQAATHLNVGSQGEALTVAALVNTLTKFPDVYRVKILIEGATVESLAGHVDLTQTFRYNDQAVSE